jgi:AcrR family transcriptional regulator
LKISQVRSGSADSKLQRTRERILKTAAGLFRDKGYAASTIRNIAAAADMKAGSVYYHFASKDDLLDAILDRGLREVHDAVRQALAAVADENDHRAKIAAAVHAHLSVLLGGSEFISANIRVHSQLPESVRKRHRPLRRAYAQLWEAMLDDALRAGVLRGDVEIVPLCQFLLGALNWTVEWFDPKKHSIKTVAQRIAKFFLDGISAEHLAGKPVAQLQWDAQAHGLAGAGADATGGTKTKEEILLAAAKLFRDRGYAGSTLRDIADATGMKPGSIYYHFESKEKILGKILDLGLREILAGVQAVILPAREGDDHRAKIAAAVQAHLILMLARSDFTSANIRIYSQLPSHIRARHRPLRQAYAKLWDTLLRDALEAGQLREDLKVVPLRQFLLSAMNWAVDWFKIERHSVDIVAARCARLILDGICAKKG